MTHDLRFGKWYVEHVGAMKAPSSPHVTLAEKAAAIKGQLHAQQHPAAEAKHRGFLASLFGLR